MRNCNEMKMQEVVLYIKFMANAEISKKDVQLKDIAKLTCKDTHILARAKAMKLHTFKEDTRQVISALKVIEEIEKIMTNVSVTCIGNNAETVVKVIQVEKKKGVMCILKIIFISMICFWGTAFTVMSFHNDIGINQMFEQIYYMVTGTESDGFTILEIAYSIGLGSGIIIFFNHIGSRRITRDPTPVEVEMRLYENDVNTTLADTADREEKTIDVS